VPVVLLHGSASSGNQWRRLAAELSPRFEVFAPDLYGHGSRPGWPGPGHPGLAAEAAVVADVVAAAGGPIHLVGHSYGGAVALHFALTHPEQLRSLVLIEPVTFQLLRHVDAAGIRLLRGIEALATSVARGVETDDVAPAMAHFVDFWNGDGTWSRMAPERRVGMQHCATAIVGHFANTIGNRSGPLDYAGLRVRTLLLHGTETPAAARYMAEILGNLIPRCAIQRVAGAGHMLPITHPDQVNPAVVAHIENGVPQGIHMRPLGRADMPRVERHLLSLDATDRRRRFGSGRADAAISAYSREIDLDRAVLFGALHGGSGELVGLAEAHPGSLPCHVELGVSVDVAYRRAGLGRSLSGAVIAAAFLRGADAAELTFSPDNGAAVGLARALGARFDRRGQGHAQITRC
jgi:pimeloyl-ACP methyl ester carboxylesterase/GNAT superfamily N-acetyltransferase